MGEIFTMLERLSKNSTKRNDFNYKVIKENDKPDYIKFLHKNIYQKSKYKQRIRKMFSRHDEQLISLQ